MLKYHGVSIDINQVTNSTCLRSISVQSSVLLKKKSIYPLSALSKVKDNFQSSSSVDKSHLHPASSCWRASYAIGTFAETSSHGNPPSLRPSCA